MKSITKDETVMLSNFDAGLRLLNTGDPKIEASYREFRKKMDLFFIDYEMVPLLV